ncbi:hypothetical protein HYC85_003092 [Camellia sinensis]|uniref:Uncharacterized protein n=1 Tax=Camellia sinensis TaxID=4442 RepID=A0A7J7IA96_CAMSI|nr:hypothetical protein HYC85_003092 [Camellia sinensis]
MPLASHFEKRRHSQASMHHRSTKHCLIPSQVVHYQHTTSEIAPSTEIHHRLDQ